LFTKLAKKFIRLFNFKLWDLIKLLPYPSGEREREEGQREEGEIKSGSKEEKEKEKIVKMKVVLR
jgi:hypothetical protein